jgi:hypothetical protein
MSANTDVQTDELLERIRLAIERLRWRSRVADLVSNAVRGVGLGAWVALCFTGANPGVALCGVGAGWVVTELVLWWWTLGKPPWRVD